MLVPQLPAPYPGYRLGYLLRLGSRLYLDPLLQPGWRMLLLVRIKLSVRPIVIHPNDDALANGDLDMIWQRHAGLPSLILIIEIEAARRLVVHVSRWIVVIDMVCAIAVCRGMRWRPRLRRRC